MLHYSAKTKYSEDAIQALCRTQFSIYDSWKSLLIILICIIGMSFAVTAQLGQTGKLLIIGACGICVSLATYPPKYKAKATLSAMKGIFPETSYFFYDTDVLLKSDGSEKHLDYSAFTRIQHDERYIYLFLSKTQAYMIDKREILPADEAGLLSLLSEKTGKHIYRSRGDSMLGLKSLLLGSNRK